jgi:type IV pilus assembly protein PilB
MGLEPYLLGSSLNLILAQRLVRKICDNCKSPTDLPEAQIRKLGLTPEQLASATFSGYRGRVPIFEFLVMDSDIREAIASGARETQIRQMARDKGYGGLLASGVSRILDGRTTAEEILRVTYADNVAQ